MTTQRTLECPSCALETEAGLEECPYCGYEFPNQKPGLPLAAWLFALLLLIPILWALFRLF